MVQLRYECVGSAAAIPAAGNDSTTWGYRLMSALKQVTKRRVTNHS
jgi:hypothetical protein